MRSAPPTQSYKVGALLSVVMGGYYRRRQRIKSSVAVVQPSRGSLTCAKTVRLSDAGDDDTAAVTAEIARQYPQKISRILRNESRLGAPQSRNVGIGANTNDIILFCDDDEYLEAGYAT